MRRDASFPSAATSHAAALPTRTGRRGSEVWVGLLFLALALPFFAHDVSWFLRHWQSMWPLRPLAGALLRSLTAAMPVLPKSAGAAAPLALLGALR